MKRFSLVLAGCAMLAVSVAGFLMFPKAGASSQQAPASGLSGPRYIEVDAQAQISAVPDLVDLHLQLREERSTPKQATAELLRKRAALLSALTKAGLPLSSITMSHLQLNIRYKRYGLEIQGYEASLTLVACLRQIERLSDFVEVAANVGVSGMSTQFRTSRIALIKLELREMALKAAYEKATQISKLTGVQLLHVKFVKESKQYSHAFSSSLSNVYAHRGLQRAQTNVQPGAIPMQFSIRVSYSIR